MSNDKKPAKVKLAKQDNAVSSLDNTQPEVQNNLVGFFDSLIKMDLEQQLTKGGQNDHSKQKAERRDK